MLEYENYKDKISSIAIAFENRRKVSFFMKNFNKFNMVDKSMILGVFEKSNRIKHNPMRQWNLF